MHLVPGDPVNLLVANQPLSHEERENLRRKLGLDRPIAQQYFYFITHALQGDFGEDFKTGQPVSRTLAEQLPATLELTAGGMLFGITVGMGLGILAALRPNGLVDSTARFVALLGVSLPGYWTAMLLIYLFGLKLGWLPIVGGGLRALILPSIVYGSFAVGEIARLVRSSLLEIRDEDYLRTARAKGLPNYRIVLHHALRNALIPVVTVIGLQLGLFLSGGVITETVFARQGIGVTLVAAILEKNYPIVRAIILLTTAAYVFVNLIVELLYVAIDPRIRYT
jgi:peptide/nickel transport system permease protein/oligopeptide transport system permease protein